MIPVFRNSTKGEIEFPLTQWAAVGAVILAIAPILKEEENFFLVSHYYIFILFFFLSFFFFMLHEIFDAFVLLTSISFLHLMLKYFV